MEPGRSRRAARPPPSSICASPTPAADTVCMHFAFGVLGRRGLAEPDRRGIRLVGRGQHAEDLGGPFDADDQYARGHRVESACVTDLSGAEDAPAAADHVVTGHTRRLVHDDKAGFGHSTIAVSVKPSRTDQRPDSVCRGGPGGDGRIDQDPRLEPARGAVAVDVERDVRVLETQASAASPGTTPCRWPPWRRTGFDPSAIRPASPAVRCAPPAG